MLHLGLSLDFASAKLVIICRITNVFAKYFFVLPIDFVRFSPFVEFGCIGIEAFRGRQR
jgi:hypothetical protein